MVPEQVCLTPNFIPPECRVHVFVSQGKIHHTKGEYQDDVDTFNLKGCGIKGEHFGLEPSGLLAFLLM